MELNVPQQKKLMPLTKFEFNLFKKLIQLEQTFSLENNKILLNLQISGGKDSMCLLQAFCAVLNSKVCHLKNNYILVVQHFNHMQRGCESNEDAYFVAAQALKKGIPVYLNSLQPEDVNSYNQDSFRQWRKKEAKNLSLKLSQELNCTHYFIVTAHHARDHVETVLLHMLRGTGVNGLTGISTFDEDNIYFRPFSAVSYSKINIYSTETQLVYREDSSNLEDKYKRNYIRKHILPHFEYLQPNYEDSFVKLSQHILSSNTPEKKETNFIPISEKTTSTELFYNLKMQNISQNCIGNILHEAKILLQKNNKDIEKYIPLKYGYKAQLIKKNSIASVNIVELYVIKP
ncbi:MAG: tRNA lysidine(34) synthetase TilS [Bdellovibrionota bacterium]